MSMSSDTHADLVERLIDLHEDLHEAVILEGTALDGEDTDDQYVCRRRREMIEREIEMTRSALVSGMQSDCDDFDEPHTANEKLSRLRESVVAAMHSVEETMASIRAARDGVVEELKVMDSKRKAQHAYDVFTVGFNR